MQFLVSLHDGYEQATSQILMLDPVPTLDRAYSMIIKVEDQKGLTNDMGNIDTRVTMQIRRAIKYKTAPNTNFKRRLSKEERMKLRCTHCSASGNEAHEYFKLHGYPDWYKELKKGQDRTMIQYVNNEVDVISEGGRSNGGKLHQTYERLYIMN